LHAGGREGSNWKKTLKAVFHLPMVYTLAAAWLFRGLHIPLVEGSPVRKALETLHGGLVPIALVTLGAQMASLKSHQLGFPLFAAMFLRLCIGPLLGFALVKLVGFQDHALAQAVVVSASFPTAVNSALLAMEYDNEPDFAASVVFYSTLVSSVTVSLVIYLVKNFM
jgi:predicted permease